MSARIAADGWRESGTSVNANPLSAAGGSRDERGGAMADFDTEVNCSIRGETFFVIGCAEAARTLFKMWLRALTPTGDPITTAARFDRIDAQGEALMSRADEIQAKLDTADEETNNIAEDIKELKALIGTGMTDAQVDAVNARLDTHVAKLRSVASAHPDAPPVE